MASVLVDDVFAKEAEDVMVDFGGKGVPTRHLRVSKNVRATCRFLGRLLNVPVISDSAHRQ